MEKTKSHSVMECYKADARIRELETQLLEASQLLEKPIGHGVGILCVSEAVRIVLVRLAEATSRGDMWERNYTQSETKTMRSLRLRAEAAEVQLAALRPKLADCENALATARDYNERMVALAAEREDRRTEELRAQLAEAQDLRNDANAAFQAMREAGLMAGTRPVTLSNLTAKAIKRAEAAEKELADFKQRLDEESAFLSKDDLVATLVERAEAAEARAEADAARWKAAIEGLTPSGSEFVDDPENCAAHIKMRLDKTVQFAKERNEARADAATLRAELNRLRAAIGPQTCEIHASFSAGCLNCRLAQAEAHAEASLSRLERAESECIGAKPERNRALAALKKVEWLASGAHFQCLWCYGLKKHGGHRPDCARQAALAPEARERELDNPDFDATDAAHPAWWRGHDHTAKMFRTKVERLKAEIAKLRGTIEDVEKYFASEGGPIYRLWENCDIGDYDDYQTDWEQTLFDVRDWKNGCVPAASVGGGTEWPEVVLYREILAALDPTPAEPTPVLPWPAGEDAKRAVDEYGKGEK